MNVPFFCLNNVISDGGETLGMSGCGYSNGASGYAFIFGVARATVDGKQAVGMAMCQMAGITDFCGGSHLTSARVSTDTYLEDGWSDYASVSAPCASDYVSTKSEFYDQLPDAGEFDNEEEFQDHMIHQMAMAVCSYNAYYTRNGISAYDFIADCEDEANETTTLVRAIKDLRVVEGNLFMYFNEVPSFTERGQTLNASGYGLRMAYDGSYSITPDFGEFTFYNHNSHNEVVSFQISGVCHEEGDDGWDDDEDDCPIGTDYSSSALLEKAKSMVRSDILIRICPRSYWHNG